MIGLDSLPDVTAPACTPDDADTFFPPSKDDQTTRAAKATCARCPAIRECLTYAITNSEQHGIWGGLTPDERHTLINRHRRSPA